MDITKEPRAYNGEKKVTITNGVGKMELLDMQKNEIRAPSHIIPKN